MSREEHKGAQGPGGSVLCWSTEMLPHWSTPQCGKGEVEQAQIEVTNGPDVLSIEKVPTYPPSPTVELMGTTLGAWEGREEHPQRAQ